MQQIFKNGSKGDNREILITIKDGAIEFFFSEQMKRHKDWIDEEIKRKQDWGEEPLTEEEKSGGGNFYWIESSDWRKSNKRWLSHMREKNWFTPQMEEFINNNAF